MKSELAWRGARDLGLAVWLGGALMGAVGLNGTAARAADRVAAARITSTGWSRWTPVGAGAIGLHLVGVAGTVKTQRGRRRGKRLPDPATAIKAATTVAAMAASTYSYLVGKRIQHAALGGDGVSTEADLSAERHERLVRAERGLGWVQWAVPALTAALIVGYAGTEPDRESRRTRLSLRRA
ncbi:hypothetical protein [Amycolatopsis sp. cmx-4-61]|uniref:hypothetical protein n=1 Tax=Amycolatopsis sp. cmx-4-61 TaxID=2790937 RepID=UPI00397D6B48